MKLQWLGDTALVICYENKDEPSRQRIHRDYTLISDALPAGITDVVLCSNTIGIYYEPDVMLKRAL